jgi:hypothetical protein
MVEEIVRRKIKMNKIAEYVGIGALCLLTGLGGFGLGRGISEKTSEKQYSWTEINELMLQGNSIRSVRRQVINGPNNSGQERYFGFEQKWVEVYDGERYVPSSISGPFSYDSEEAGEVADSIRKTGRMWK